MFYNEREYCDFPYTDLACERRRVGTDIRGVDFKREATLIGSWERIKISSPEGAKSIGRPMGLYDTLELERMDLIDLEGIDDASDEIARELCYMCDMSEVVPDRVLVVGLGNPELTPDAIGPEAARGVKATMHIKDFDKKLFSDLECSEIAVVTPGVSAMSGMDASVTVKGVCEKIRPSVIFAVDALASRSAERLGRTVQISNTGIFPGSGIGNGRNAISKETVGVPVIAIGVPTIIDSRMFCYDLWGNGDNTRDGARESMFVSPKEINEIVKAAGKIISGGINQAFGLFY
ncbi:MAG: GPR endopeptidase [Clostridia bacterium]|nr:GPR endopeptidase [Clostridia bacterium]